MMASESFVLHTNEKIKLIRTAGDIPRQTGLVLISVSDVFQAHPKEGNNAFSVFVDAASRVPWQGKVKVILLSIGSSVCGEGIGVEQRSL